MRILFDQGVPVPLRRTLASHAVTTVFELGWSNLDNGDLLRAAEGRFDLFVTTDKNLKHEQNLTGRRLGILVLPTTNWLEIRQHQAEVAWAVEGMKAGQYFELRW
ncbi:MAG: hypothetical protein N3I86_04615 [Verrucomicrobiae bacterium]|nr:hypothetical protein [Verrucomicrobiae bacterium]